MRPAFSLLCCVCLLSATATSDLAAQAPRAQPTRPAGDSLDQWQASGRRGVVVAGGPEAVDAGMALLEAGGNAADAAAATLLALTVTDAHQFCFGGEVPVLVFDGERSVVEALSGQGAAPRLATRERFEAEGGIPGEGITAATVPAVLGVCVTLLERYGTVTFAEAAAPTLRILGRGEHPWHEPLARTLRRLIEAEEEAGERRRGLRLVDDGFYRGPIAREIDAWSQASGGLLRYSDLATHVTRVEEPVTAAYRGYAVTKCGPWTQGPALLQALQLLEGFEPVGLREQQDADAAHLPVEALKLGLADRDAWYGDPLFEDVPLPRLLSPEYVRLRRGLIDLEAASHDLRPGDPRAGAALRAPSTARSGDAGPSHDTTTCLVADGQGNVITATPSGWSGELCPELGIWFGTRLQSFNLWEDHPNRLEPGKRPRITLTPTLVLEEGRPAFAVSVAGGDLQDQVSLQLLLNLIDGGLSPAEAVTAPRFSTDHLIGSFRQTPAKPGSLTVNPGIGEAAIEELRRRGHEVRVSEGVIGHPSALRIDRESGWLEGAGDPRAGRHAAAF